MKFLSVLDVQTFLVETGSFSKLTENLSASYVPTNEEMDSFIKSRSEYVGKMKNYRKSANQKANWRDNRTKMMKGVKAFHKSVEGKRFHRKLGRFLASRITRKKNENRGYEGFLEQLDFLVGLNSTKQHLFTEMNYFHQAQEQIELEEMILDYAIPMFRSIEEKIVTSQDLNEDETIFLIDITESQDIVNGIADIMGKDLKEVEDVVAQVSESIEKDGIAKGNEQFYPVLVTKLSDQSWETLSAGAANKDS